MIRLKASKPRLGGVGPRLRTPPKIAEQFYSSPEWKRLVAERKRDGDYFAALARRKDRSERVILDHIVERRDGGADLERSNTQWLTFSEHQVKTAKAKAKRATER